MDDVTRAHLENIFSADKAARNAGYAAILAATEKPVTWAYQAWDTLVGGLRHKDNHVRSIAAQVLVNLAAYSDPQKRIIQDFEALLNGTRDAKFVTARHTLQSLWKVGLGGTQQRQLVINGLARRFEDCASEKNCTLVRYDIVQNIRQLYNAAPDELVRERALTLIASEPDEKYRKKYMTVWK